MMKCSSIMHGALLCASLALSGCSAGDALKLLTGSGPNVAANTQAGKTNSQTIGASENVSQKIVRPKARSIEQSTGDTRVRSDRVETVVVHEKDAAWLIISLIIASGMAVAGWIHGWFTPSPRERRLKRELEALKKDREMTGE